MENYFNFTVMQVMNITGKIKHLFQLNLSLIYSQLKNLDIDDKIINKALDHV